MPNPTIVTGAGTGNAFATNELKVDMSEMRMKSFSRLTALTTILLRLSKDPAHNFRVDLTEEHEIPTTVLVAADMAASGSTLNIQDFGLTMVQDTILWNPDNDEYLRVTTTASSNAIAVTNFDGTAAIWKLGDVVYVLPPALVENDALTTFRKSSVVDTNVFNYTQIMKLQFGINRQADKVSTWFGGAGSKRQQLQRQKFREFKVKDENQKWFGTRTAANTTAVNARYSSNGIKQVLQDGTLFKDFGGVFTESGWDNYLGNYFDENPDVNTVAFFGAPNVLRQINYFAKNKIRISPNSKKYGLRLDEYIGGDFNIDLIRTPIFSASPITKGWGFILDLERIKLKELDPMMLHKEALNVGQSEEIIDTYRLVDSMLLANENRHSMMVGATQ